MSIFIIGIAIVLGIVAHDKSKQYQELVNKYFNLLEEHKNLKKEYDKLKAGQAAVLIKEPEPTPVEVKEPEPAATLLQEPESEPAPVQITEPVTVAAPIEVKEHEPAFTPVQITKTESVSMEPTTKENSVKTFKESIFSKNLWQAKTALVLGTLFIIFAGFIFATTTWRILPNIVKILVLVSITVLFFFGSELAKKKFNIDKTSKALYILGSLFIFVSVVSAGFFELFGYDMSPSGKNNFLLFFFATLFTEISILFGLKKFTDRIYAYLSLCGISICFFLLTFALDFDISGFALAFAGYSAFLIFFNTYFQKNINTENAYKFISPSIKEVFENFCYGNLLLASIIIIIATNTKWPMGVFTILLGFTHIYHSYKKSDLQSDTASVSFLILMIAGFYKIMPPTYTRQVLIFTSGLFSVFFVFNYVNTYYIKLISKKIEVVLTALVYVFAAIALISSNVVLIFKPEYAAEAYISLALLLVCSIIESLRKKPFFLAVNIVSANLYYQVLYTYKFDLYLMLGFVTLICMLIVFAQRRKLFSFPDKYSYIFYIVLGIANSLLSYTIYLTAYIIGKFSGEQITLLSFVNAAIAVIFMLYLFIIVIKEKFPALRHLFPVAGLFLLQILSLMLRTYVNSKIDYRIPVLLYMLGFMIFEYYMNVGISYSLLSLSLVLSLIFYFEGLLEFFSFNLPHMNIYTCCISSSLLAANLAFIYIKRKNREGDILYKDIFSVINLMLIIHIFTSTLLPIYYLLALCTGSWFILFLFKNGKPGFVTALRWLVFITGLALSIYCEVQIKPLTPSYIIPILLNFAAIYAVNYIAGDNTLCIVSYLAVLPLPLVVLDNSYSGHIVYIISYALLIGIGAFSRSKFKIIELNENFKESKFDLLNILAVLHILSFILFSNNEVWRFLSALMLCLYFLQYAQIERLKPFALLACEFSLTLAFYLQPWLDMPKLIQVEAFILPLTLCTYSLPLLFGKKDIIEKMQTGLYLAFHVILLVDTFTWYDINNILLFEGLCLCAFLYFKLIRQRILYTFISSTAALLGIINMSFIHSYIYESLPFICTLCIGAYLLQYTRFNKIKSYILAASSFTLVIAFWLQPWFKAPELIQLETVLLPLAVWIYFLPRIFGETKYILYFRLFAYTIFHFILLTDLFRYSEVYDALMFEAVCLACFLWNNIKKNRVFTIISSVAALIVLFYMTRSFWFSIAWWIYLLVAGLGLIGYAAFNEMKKNK